jgi:flavodoxin/NAD-dependent dihydropyrimidine dehydrogenase PreA subunit
MVYFSQTGNTRKVAEAMAAGFQEMGHSARTVPLKKATSDDVLKTDLLGVGAPCFSSQSPTPVKEFLRKLPPLAGRRAFVFATSGGAPGTVLYDITRLLRSKGADVVGGDLFRGALYHPAPCFKGRFAGRPDAEDLARARRFAIAVAQHVSSAQNGALAESRPDAFKAKWAFYSLVSFMSKDRLVRLLLPEPKLVTSKCDQCRWCVSACPMDNITMEPNPVLGSRCIRCYRCLTGCPKKPLL